MKRAILILMTVLPIIGYTQSIGIKGGVLISNMKSYSKYIDEKTLIGQSIGVVYQHDFNRVKLFIEPTYSTKGFSSEYTVTDNAGNRIGTEKAKFKFNYFELPVLVGYNLIDKDSYLGFNAGFSPNFLTSAKVKSPRFKDNIDNNNSIGVDLLAGGYLGYKISDHLFAGLNLRYGKGLSKPNKNSDATYSYFNTFINLSYKF